MADGLTVGKLIVHIGMNASSLMSGMASANKSLENMANKMASFGAKMSLAVTAPLALLGRKAVKEFSEFDKAMTKSLAVMDDASFSMRHNLEALAVSLSTKVATSATDLAKGYFELGQAGLTASQAMQALPIAESFAYAGSMHLSQAVSYLTKTQRALGMEMQDPIKNMEQMQRVADNLTFAAIESTAEMIDFSEAMKNAGPALRILGKDVEEGTAALMALANQGHVGSEAGTQLYMVYRDVQRANITQRAVWEKLGLSVYDVHGEMFNLADIIEQLERRFSGMSDEGTRSALMMLGFQDRSLRATQALFGLSSAMRKYEELLKQSIGLTKKIQEHYLKSFSAQMDIVRNKLNIIIRGIGQHLAKLLESLIPIVTKLVRAWNMMSEEMQMFIVQSGIIVGVIGPLFVALSMLTKVLTATIGMWLKFAAVILTPVAGILAIIGLAYVLKAAWNKNIGNIKGEAEKFFQIFAEGYDWLNEVTGGFLDKWVMGWKEGLKQLRGDWSETISFLAIAQAGLKSGFAKMLEVMKTGGGKEGFFPIMREAIRQAGEEFDAQVLSDLEAFLPMQEVVSNSLNQASKTANFVITASAQAGNEIVEATKQQLSDDLQTLITLTDTHFPKIKATIESIMEGLTDPKYDIPQEGLNAYMSQLEKVKEEINKLMKDSSNSKEMENWVVDNLEYERRRLEINAQLSQELFREEKSFYHQMMYLKSQKEQLELNGGEIKLINKWLERQTELLTIQIKKYGTIGEQLHAAALQMKLDIEQTAGPWYEFATSMPDMLENGFMRILQAGRNWKEQMKAFLQEIAWEFVRIQAIKPIAMGLSQSFTMMAANKTPLGPSSAGTYTPPSFDYQVPGKLAEGGLATKPHLTWIAEKEPELVTPLSKLNTVFNKKEAPTIIVNNQTSTPISPSSIQWDPQRMVASVLLKDDRNRGPVSRSMKGRK